MTIRFLALSMLIALPCRAGLLSNSFTSPESRVEIPPEATGSLRLVQMISPLAAGNGYRIDGVPASLFASGNSKDVVLAPTAPQDQVIKIFRGTGSQNWPAGIAEKEAELDRLARLPASVVPRVLEHGVTDVAGRKTAYLVQQRVDEQTLHDPTPDKVAKVRALFAKLAEVSLELTETSESQLRSNIMIGRAGFDGEPQAYLVSPTIVRSDKTKGDLYKFYEELIGRIEDAPPPSVSLEHWRQKRRKSDEIEARRKKIDSLLLAASLARRKRDYVLEATLRLQIAIQFPQAIEAPGALYDVATIYEKDLKDVAKAMTAYQEVARAYPNYSVGKLAAQHAARLARTR